MTDKITKLADAVSAFVVGPRDRLVISLPGSDPDDAQELASALEAKGWDLTNVLILAGEVQIGVIDGDVPEPPPSRWDAAPFPHDGAGESGHGH